MKLGEILINRKLISWEKLKPIIAKQLSNEKRLGEILVEEKLISDEYLAIALREQYWRKNGFWTI
ncbi:MAG: hypothetical protein F6K10_25485 [Moorea sp. SIO2B7]|nr:hypothetical protein [Moorena sp. SIO2B7]